MRIDDANITGEEPLICKEELPKVDLLESAQWSAWKARASIERRGLYADDHVDEVRERKLFEKWQKGLSDGVA